MGKYQNKNQEQNVQRTEKGEKKPRFMNSTGVKSKNAPLSNNADTNNKQQQYSTSNTYGTNSGNTNQAKNQSQSNKPNFANSKGAINNNTPLNPNAKVERTERTKITGTFQKTNDQNDNVKAPKKDYLEGSSDVKYKEEIDVNIEKRVFQVSICVKYCWAEAAACLIAMPASAEHAR